MYHEQKFLDFSGILLREFALRKYPFRGVEFNRLISHFIARLYGMYVKILFHFGNFYCNLLYCPANILVTLMRDF